MISLSAGRYLLLAAFRYQRDQKSVICHLTLREDGVRGHLLELYTGEGLGEVVTWLPHFVSLDVVLCS